MLPVKEQLPSSNTMLAGNTGLVMCGSSEQLW